MGVGSDRPIQYIPLHWSERSYIPFGHPTRGFLSIFSPQILLVFQLKLFDFQVFFNFLSSLWDKKRSLFQYSVVTIIFEKALDLDEKIF